MAKRNKKQSLNQVDELDPAEDELDEFAGIDEEPGSGPRALAADAAEEAGLDDELGEDLDEFEESRLTMRQKLWVGLCATASFVVFLVIFFPLNEFLRYQLGSFSKQIQADFVDLDLNLFSPDTVDGLSVQLPNNGPRFTAGRIESQLAWLDLLGSAPDGPVRIDTAEFAMSDLAFTARQINLDIDIADVRNSLAVWDGQLDIQARGVRFDRLPLDKLPIPIDLSELKIGRLDLKLLFEDGAVSFPDGKLVSDLFRLTLKGSGRMGNTLGATTVDARVCIEPVSDLENKNPDLFTIYIMGGGAAGGELCADINGSIGAPNFQLDRSANSFSGPFSGPDGPAIDESESEDEGAGDAAEEGESGGTDV